MSVGAHHDEGFRNHGPVRDWPRVERRKYDGSGNERYYGRTYRARAHYNDSSSGSDDDVTTCSKTSAVTGTGGAPGASTDGHTDSVATNCGQCKIMYGEYFDGRKCAEECVSTVGYIQPDCDIADTIVKYLRRKP
ncbi:hypothetical protein MTO96_023819 [Rhipicephalus appendiculatus]